MKTIKDAVIELDGKLPNRTYTKYSNAAGWYISRDGKLSHEAQDMWFEPEEFESEAKRMGYINGYRWGVEYPTNGQRPDLTDDVLISVAGAMINGNWYMHELTNLTVDWIDVINFKVIDPRYKPVDEVSEISESKPDAEAVSEKTESNWFEIGDLPPVGSIVEIAKSTNFMKISHPSGAEVKIYAHFTDDRGVNLAAFVDSLGKVGGLGVAEIFKPIRTEREKVIEAALDAAIENDGLYGPLVPHINQILERIYDAGMLVLPPKKSDTED